MRMHRDEVHDRSFPWGRINRRDIWHGLIWWEVQLRYERGVALCLTASTWADAVRLAEMASRDQLQTVQEQAICFEVYA